MKDEKIGIFSTEPGICQAVSSNDIHFDSLLTGSLYQWGRNVDHNHKFVSAAFQLYQCMLCSFEALLLDAYMFKIVMSSWRIDPFIIK
jgi:hypothetical protein